MFAFPIGQFLKGESWILIFLKAVHSGRGMLRRSPLASDGLNCLKGNTFSTGTNRSGTPFYSFNPMPPFSSLGTLQIQTGNWEMKSKLSRTRKEGGGEGVNHLKTKEES